MPGNIPKTIRLYRITHIGNLPHILHAGICNKNHPAASPDYIVIGNNEIIEKRTDYAVKIEGYGNIGDYVPFYFTPYSIMLLNIISGWKNVKQFPRENIIHLICNLSTLANAGLQYFFTNGQANALISKHLNTLSDLHLVDWAVIASKNFKNTEEDLDRQRRYQAEFLIYHHVPVNYIDEIVVYNEHCATFVKEEIQKAKLTIPVTIKKAFYFDR